MGRCLHTTLPQVVEHLTPKWTYLTDFRREDERFKEKQKKNFDCRHRVQDLPDIPDEHEVWINSGSTSVRGTVVTSAGAPHSYIVSTPTESLRRNQIHLGIVPPPSEDPGEQGPQKIMTRTQTGTEIRPPARFRDQIT